MSMPVMVMGKLWESFVTFASVLLSAGTNVFVYILKPHFWGGNFNVSVLVKAQSGP